MRAITSALVALAAAKVSLVSAGQATQIFAPAIATQPELVAVTYNSDMVSCPAFAPNAAEYVWERSTDTLWLVRKDRRVAYSITTQSVAAFKARQKQFPQYLAEQHEKFKSAIPKSTVYKDQDWDQPASVPPNHNFLSDDTAATSPQSSAWNSLLAHLASLRGALAHDPIIGGFVPTTFTCRTEIHDPPYTVDSSTGQPRQRHFSARQVSESTLSEWKSYKRQPFEDYYLFSVEKSSSEKAP